MKLTLSELDFLGDRIWRQGYASDIHCYVSRATANATDANAVRKSDITIKLDSVLQALPCEQQKDRMITELSKILDYYSKNIEMPPSMPIADIEPNPNIEDVADDEAVAAGVSAEAAALQPDAAVELQESESESDPEDDACSGDLFHQDSERDVFASDDEDLTLISQVRKYITKNVFNLYIKLSSLFLDQNSV